MTDTIAYFLPLFFTLIAAWMLFVVLSIFDDILAAKREDEDNCGPAVKSEKDKDSRP